MKQRIWSFIEALRNVAKHLATREAGGEWLAAAFFVILVVPAGPDHVLVPMLAVTTGIGAFAALAATRAQHHIRAGVLGFAAAGAVLVVHGVVRSTPGWTDVAVPLVGGPIAWFLIAQLANPWFAKRVIDIAAVATIAIGLMVYALKFDVGSGIVRWIEPGAFSFSGAGRSRTSLAGLTTLSATVPMLLSSILDRVVARVPTPRVALHTAAVAFCLPAVLLSGRQGVIGTIAIFPILFVVRHLLGFDFRGLSLPTPRWPAAKVVAVGGAVLVASALIAMVGFDLSPASATQDILASVGIGDAASARVVYSAEVRALQSDSLLGGFADQPIFGHGGGAVSPEYQTWRGYDLGTDFVFSGDFEPRPWRAELSYQLLLFEGGLVGAAAYLAAAVWAAHKVRSAFLRQDNPVMRSVLRATVVGALSIMVAAAFNAHLRAVGAQVLLFLPLIVAASIASPMQELRKTTSS